jgi:hypothetical protein
LWRRVDANTLEKHIASIFWVENGILNESNVVENRSAHFRVTPVAQQSFHVTLCVISILREWLSRLNHGFQFDETDFMQLFSSVMTHLAYRKRG